MTDKEKNQRELIPYIKELSTTGYEVVQGNFNLSKNPQWFRIDVNGKFKIKKGYAIVFNSVDKNRLMCLACELGIHS